MRALTAAFLGLVGIPAVVLAWLGFRFTASLEEQARAAAERETLRATAQLTQQAREVEGRFRDRLETALDGAVRRIVRRLPFEPPGRVLRDARRGLEDALSCPAIVIVRDPGGRQLYPRGPGPPAVEPALAEAFERAARLEFRAGRPTAAAQFLERVGDTLDAARLKALAWSAAAAVRGRHGLENDLSRLRALPRRAVMRAGPLAINALSADAGWLAAAERTGRLAEVPATAAARLRWHRMAHPDAAGPPAHLAAALEYEAEGATSAFFVVRRPLRDGVELEVALRLAPSALLPASVEGLPVSYASGGDVVVEILGRRVHARVRNPALDDIEHEAVRRRRLTMLGIGALLALMAVGLFLVQSALGRERAARRLRDDFIANVSHELKTPLTSVRMYAEMLAEKGVPAAKRRAYAEVVEAEGARLASLVEDMLDFAALERGTRRLEPEPVDLQRLLEATAAAWRPAAEREDVALLVESADGDASALADPTALGRVLTNLLQNAWKHGRPARNGETSRVRLCAGPGPRVEVRDNGPGIPAAERAHVFERFRQGARATGGAGIGLALSRELARAMSGDLTVEDDGEETIFLLALPPVAEGTACEGS